MSGNVLLFPGVPRKPLAWEFARTIWGSRADFPHGEQYPGIVTKLAAGFTIEQLQEAIRKTTGERTASDTNSHT